MSKTEETEKTKAINSMMWKHPLSHIENVDLHLFP